jgi:hypothetical protein
MFHDCRDPLSISGDRERGENLTRGGLYQCYGDCSRMVRQKTSVSAGSKAVPSCCPICCRASLKERDNRSGFSAVRSS